MFSEAVRAGVIQDCFHQHFRVSLLIQCLQRQDEGLHPLESVVVLHRDNRIALFSSVDREEPDECNSRFAISLLCPNPF